MLKQFLQDCDRNNNNDSQKLHCIGTTYNVLSITIVSNFEILYIYVFCIYVEGPKADELSLMGFTLMK